MTTERNDVSVATGAQWAMTYVRYTPGTPVAASAIVAGDRVFVDGRPLLVARVQPEGVARVVLTFGEGLYDDPRLALVHDALLAPAEPVPILEAIAAYSLTDVDVDGLPVVTPVEIPTTIEADTVTVSLGLTADETAALYDWAGTYSWDLYVRTAEDDWQRALEGSFSIVAGDAR